MEAKEIFEIFLIGSGIVFWGFVIIALFFSDWYRNNTYKEIE